MDMSYQKYPLLPDFHFQYFPMLHLSSRAADTCFVFISFIIDQQFRPFYLKVTKRLLMLSLFQKFLSSR